MNRINPITNQPEYEPAVLEALRAFRHSKPWRGTVAERKEKFNGLHGALCRACSVTAETWKLEFEEMEPEAEHGNGGLDLHESRIVLLGKLSVVTYLYCFAMAVRDRDRTKAMAWAVGLYKRIFPLSAARMSYADGMVIKPCNLN